MSFKDQEHLLNQLDGFPLLPCGPTDKVPSGKSPINPSTGKNLTGWEEAAYTPEELLSLNGNSHRVTSIGMHNGPKANYTCTLDLDGKSALDLAKTFGCSAKQVGWLIGRNTSSERLKVPLHIPEGLREFFNNANGEPIGKVVLTTKQAEYELDENGNRKRGDDGKLIKTADSEQVELFWATGQTVVLGQHIPSGGQYTWTGGPIQMGEPNLEWWAFIVHILNEGQKPSISSKSSNSDAQIVQSGPSEKCVVCGRNTSGACSRYVDGERVRINCFEGQSFNPIDEHGTLTTGETIEGSDGVTYEFKGQGFNPSIGSFSKFIEHVEDEPAAQPSGAAQGEGSLSKIDEWDGSLANLVDPDHPNFERNTIRRQIRAATSAAELQLRVSPVQVRSRLIQKQRTRLKNTEEKGVSGGQVASFAEQVWLISNLISADCLTSIAAFVKVGKTKCLTELVSSLVFQHPFMGNPQWMPSPEKHKFILWWTDQPGVNSATYLKARGLMDADGTLHPQIVKLYTQEDNLCWDDEGMDELIEITTKHPGAILISDSFYANVRPVHGSDQEPEAGGALIDIQTYCADKTRAHICAFHSPQDRDKLGMEAIRGHGSAKGVPSGGISIHFIDKKDSRTGRWVPDKETPYRRVVVEGRMPYEDLLVAFDGAAGTWDVIGKFEQSLAELQSTEGKAEAIDGLSQGQRETLECLGAVMGMWKLPKGVSAYKVAAAKFQEYEQREPTRSEVAVIRKQLDALHREQLVTTSKEGRETIYAFRVDG